MVLPQEKPRDILKYGPDVEVLGPLELREEVVSRVRRMGEVY
jgi:predicted DNA-binding transcriptional regulator YafY